VRATRKGVRGWATSSAFELVVILAIAAALALGIQAFFVKPYRIPSGSMLPTLKINQRVVVNRIGTHFSAPHVGDIIVFHPPRDYASCADPREGGGATGGAGAMACDVPQSRPSSVAFIKRVVGVPGDRISIRDGHVIRDGVREPDSYIVPCGGGGSCDFPATITIPRGDYFMMGDNRPDSQDSRFWGPVPRAWIVGRAFLTYWPPNQIGSL